MDKKKYKKLMLAGLVPWRPDVIKKNHYIRSEEDLLLQDGWRYVKLDSTLKWKNSFWRLLYKIIDEKPRQLPGFPSVASVTYQDKDGNDFTYRYVEFKAVDQFDKTVNLYARGNFLRGLDRPYLMKNRQIEKL